MEAAIEDRANMRELPLESVRAGIVKTKTLSTRVSVSPTAGDQRDKRPNPREMKSGFRRGGRMGIAGKV